MNVSGQEKVVQPNKKDLTKYGRPTIMLLSTTESEVNSMTDREKRAGEIIAKAISEMGSVEKAQLLAFVEGMAFARLAAEEATAS